MSSTKEKSDLDVVKEILNGDKEKYALLIKKYNQRLYRIAKSILWNEEESEDAMQEAYVKAYQQLKKFQQRSSFGTWLTRILINECLMKKRQQKRHKEISDETAAVKISSNGQGPDKKMLNKELKFMLENAIAQLPEKYRLVFVMREIEHMSVSEVTGALDITETNTKARLSRAKEMLRDTLVSQYPLQELMDFHAVRCARMAERVFARI
jgi:RNA polymerase sigma factor (sigma-70 family)